MASAIFSGLYLVFAQCESGLAIRSAPTRGNHPSMGVSSGSNPAIPTQENLVFPFWKQTTMVPTYATANTAIPSSSESSRFGCDFKIPLQRMSQLTLGDSRFRCSFPSSTMKTDEPGSIRWPLATSVTVNGDPERLPTVTATNGWIVRK
mgnify:CR=1 FL=1